MAVLTNGNFFIIMVWDIYRVYNNRCMIAILKVFSLSDERSGGNGCLGMVLGMLMAVYIPSHLCKFNAVHSRIW